MKPSLLVPVEGNHNQTMFLLALTLSRPAIYHLYATRTENLADKAIRKVCLAFGVKIVDSDEANVTEYGKVYCHGWGVPKVIVDSLKFDSLYLYGDGLTNRFMSTNWPQVSGLVVWGTELFEPHVGELAYDNMSLEFVSSIHIKETWRTLLRVSGAKSHSFGDYSEVLIVAMRYWCTSTYSGVSIDSVREVLQSVAEQIDTPKLVLVKRDSRWNSKQGEMAIVKGVFGNSEVEEFEMPKSLRQRLGHLACMDALAYSEDFSEVKIFGFDGSLPLTFALTQPNSHVLVPSWRPLSNPDLPPNKFITENLDWQSSVLRHDGEVGNLFPAQVESQSLRDAISSVRHPGTSSDAEFGAVARVLIRDWADPKGNDILFLEALLRRYSSSGIRTKSAFGSKIKQSRLVTAMYFVAIRNLRLRRLIRWMVGKFGL